MITALVSAIAVALIGCFTGVFSFIRFLIERHDEKKESTLKQISDRLDKTERDSVRLQLFVLICLTPDSREEIMTVAQRYFQDLKGDWWMTSIFRNWLKQQKTEPPVWFTGEEKEDF